MAPWWAEKKKLMLYEFLIVCEILLTICLLICSNCISYCVISGGLVILPFYHGTEVLDRSKNAFWISFDGIPPAHPFLFVTLMSIKCLKHNFGLRSILFVWNFDF
jgi:hypothetical protein